MSALRAAPRQTLALALGAALVAAVSWLPAGIGNVGRKTATLTGGSGKAGEALSGGMVTVVLPGASFMRTITPGETPTQVRDALVAQIDAHHLFTAIATDDPADSNLAAFQVRTSTGEVPASLQIVETDTLLDDIGIRFVAGRGQTTFRKPGTGSDTIVGDGACPIRIERLAGTDFSQSFSTSGFAGNPSGFNATIKSALLAAGFTVTETATQFTVSQSGDLIVATQVDCSDTGVATHDVSIRTATAPPPSPSGLGFPNLSDWALFALATILTGAGMILLRRRRNEAAE